MSPRPDVSEKRRDQILEAATKVFTERGFASARMDDIVAEAKLSKGALYWYFDSKDALIVGILDRVFDWETSHLRELIDREDSAQKMLQVIFDTMIQDIEKMKPLMPLFLEFWSLSVRRQTINQAIKRYYQKFLDLIEPIIERGIQRGEFRPVDIKDTAIAIGAIFEGTILFYVYFPDTVHFENQFKANLEIISRGLLDRNAGR